MNTFYQIEGIIIRTLDYKEKQKILTVFTEDGIVSFITYTSNNKLNRSLFEPATCADFFYSKTKSELFKINEMNIKNSNYSLRNCYEKIHAASNILKALLQTQLPGKPSPMLYQLTKAYLKQLGKSSHPQGIEASFLLKLLRHEGLLAFEDNSPSLDEDSTLIKALCYTKDFAFIENIPLEDSFLTKVETLFNERLGV